MSGSSNNLAKALAFVIVVAIGITIYLEYFLPRCTLSSSEVVRSSDNNYFAYLEWRQCANPRRSFARVMIGTATSSEKIVAIEFRPPEDEVELDWRVGGLTVTLPSTSTVKQYGPYAEWPSVQIVRM